MTVRVQLLKKIQKNTKVILTLAFIFNISMGFAFYQNPNSNEFIDTFNIKSLEYHDYLTKLSQTRSNRLEVEKRYQKSIKICTEKHDTLELVNFINEFGIHYYRLENIDKSNELFLRALDLLSRYSLSDTLVKVKATLNNNIGWNCMKLQDYECAIKYLDFALKLVEGKNIKIESRVYNNLGVVYSKLKLLDESLEYYQKALDINQRRKDSVEIQLNLNNIGNIHFERKDYEQAEFYFLTALEFNYKLANRDEIINNLNNLAKLHIALHNIDKAENYLYKSLVISDSIGSLSSKEFIYEKLIILKRIRKDYKGAFELMTEKEIISDSLDKIASISKLKELEQDYELNLSHLENQRLSKENELKALDINNKKLVIRLSLIILILSILSIIILIIYLRKRNSDNQNLNALNKKVSDQNDQLLRGSKELEIANSEIRSMNDNLEKIVSQKTQLLQVEKQLTEQLLNSLPGIFYYYEKEGSDYKLKRWNKNHSLITGYSENELNGMSITSFFQEKDRKEVLNVLQNASKNEKLIVESRLLKKNKSFDNWYLFEGYLFNDNEKEFLIGLGIDIQDKKISEKKLNLSTELLKSQNEKLKNFAFYNAHKLRGPFCRVKGLLLLEWQGIELPPNYNELLTYSIDELESVIMEIQEIIHEK